MSKLAAHPSLIEKWRAEFERELQKDPFADCGDDYFPASAYQIDSQGRYYNRDVQILWAQYLKAFLEGLGH